MSTSQMWRLTISPLLEIKKPPSLEACVYF
jgi:hypothetical protein